MHERDRDFAAVVPLIVSIVAIAAGMAVGLGELWAVLHEQWTYLYGPNEHGYLVLAMGIWVAVNQWRARPAPTIKPGALALVPLLLCSLALVALNRLDFGLARLCLLPLFLISTIASVWGYQVAARLFWGVMFMYFALPQWEIINGPLQALTVSAVSTILRWTGVPAFLDGNVVHIPSGVFEIASGCSGLNYLMAGTALAAFVAMTQLDVWKGRIVLVAIAALGAIVFNWLRVFVVILIGHLSGMQHYLVRVEHHTFGWILFLLLMGPMIVFVSRANQGGPEEPPASRGQRGARSAMPGALPWSVVWMTVPAVLILLIARAYGNLWA